MKKLTIIAISALLLSACNNEVQTKNNKEKQSIEHKSNDIQTNKGVNNKALDKEVKDGITYIDGILIVNKEINLPKNYNPDVDATANEHLNTLIQNGNSEGLNLVLRSAFRSYDTQANLYQQYVARDGKKKADTYSAQPGHSEHQTGLAFDLGNAEGSDDFLESFEDTKEGQWLARHAHEYGFIIRYPKGKSDITGYQYEPWHLRYLGKETATKVYESGLTLEEYLGLK
ncbi:M15 family metallopeptidase [Macrococcus armenti]|uniref:M15 family metallopeptidase n=1 Tax=Macrococcus armenti TaxID=2875764 RepID=A0ABY3ZTA8_9STAP|nr:M15 family metallopeptidase [Macrococcus armenti]UOB20147.1 M15 family metallopeptidase [Macrococcus armenti]